MYIYNITYYKRSGYKRPTKLKKIIYSLIFINKFTQFAKGETRCNAIPVVSGKNHWCYPNTWDITKTGYCCCKWPSPAWSHSQTAVQNFVEQILWQYQETCHSLFQQHSFLASEQREKILLLFTTVHRYCVINTLMSVIKQYCVWCIQSLAVSDITILCVMYTLTMTVSDKTMCVMYTLTMTVSDKTMCDVYNHWLSVIKQYCDKTILCVMYTITGCQW